MPLETQSSKSSKGKRIKSFGRVSSSADPDYSLPYSRVDDGDVILPIAFRPISSHLEGVASIGWQIFLKAAVEII
ncbi:hypothetical protein AVEN_138175-1 [Araneus ventricosus]|uniref:Uncharacterized protein n=1 Tax=Araneus ventricosus TaxID=182803 RepID=A0A4Y2HSF1_ARAVE|nr:hypothetical protein AVEN_138175-1 [Araneus ventricosus]